MGTCRSPLLGLFTIFVCVWLVCSSTSATTTTLDADTHMHASRERHLKSMEFSGHHYQRGVWSYGDYKHNANADTPQGCAKLCEEDEGCLHWNFQVVQHICNLKGESSGHDDSVPDWISGNAKRYVPKPKSSEL